MTCPWCGYCAQQMERMQDELLALRLQVADGPRTRVRELERTVARLNTKIAELNRRGR